MNREIDQSPLKSEEVRPHDKTLLYLGTFASLFALLVIGIDQIIEGHRLRGMAILATVILWIFIVAILKKHYKIVKRESTSDH